MRFIPILIISCISLFANAQKGLYNIVNSSSGEGQIQAINPTTHLFNVETGNIDYSNTKHNYLIHNKELYLQLDGTGRIYKCDLINNRLIRIDSTLFEGYNFGAYTFNWHNQFYSFGGWGFWQFNGGLRYFDEKQKEWDVIPLEKEVPFSLKVNAVAWQDELNDKIYILYNPQNSSYYKNFRSASKDTVLVQCFDLNSKKWWDNPKLTSFKSHIIFDKSEALLLPTKEGLIIRNDSSINLLDFRNNNLLKFNNTLYNEINTLALKYRSGLYYNRDTTIYFYNQVIDSIASIVINKNEFINTGQRVYTEYKINSSSFINNNDALKLISFLLLLLVIVLIAFLRKSLIKQNESQDAIVENRKKNKKLDINTSLSFSNNLTEQEKSVFEIILQNSMRNEMTSIDDINIKLGVKNKEVAVQNQLRSEVLQMLNKKFNVFSSSNDLLIEREKTVFDKRVYQYRINSRYLNKVD